VASAPTVVSAVAQRAAARPPAFVSMDVDPVDTHLAGYGIAAPPCDVVYRAAVPRALDLLDRLGIRATFFVVARDAAAHAALWRDARRRGHEIGSHSLSHPIPFASLPAAQIARELGESRRRIEDAVGEPVLGFRAPGWDVDRATLRAIAAAGYRYDASILPTPALLVGAGLRFVLSAGRKRPHGVGRSLRAAVSRRAPYAVRAADGLCEFPVAVSPRLRIPFTHTLNYVAPPALCRRAYAALRRSRTPLSYMLHAADALDLHRDGVDPRFGRHPGMQLPLDRKLALLDERLAAIRRDYAVTTYADWLQRR
jgi:peptidoglycan/xylan/chitin deacetylase (PgdA/CDA1 family)